LQSFLGNSQIANGNLKLNYWEARYRGGDSSGQGSIGAAREWKWQIIHSYVENIDEVIDVGCGDLSFWEDKDCPSYLGLDVSPTIIQRNMHKRPHWEFLVSKAEDKIPGRTARIVFCFDLLFHVMTDDTYYQILENLCAYAREWIFISTWSKNPFGLLRFGHSYHLLMSGYLGGAFRMLFLPRISSDRQYQRYRKFNPSIFIANRFRPLGRHLAERSISEIWVFRKQNDLELNAADET